MSAYANFYIKPAEYEQIETVIHLSQDNRPSITGTVLSDENTVCADALVTLYTTDEKQNEFLLSSSYTDQEGKFIFGPLDPETRYHIRIYKNNLQKRIIEQKIKKDRSN